MDERGYSGDSSWVDISTLPLLAIVGLAQMFAGDSVNLRTFIVPSIIGFITALLSSLAAWKLAYHRTDRLLFHIGFAFWAMAVVLFGSCFLWGNWVMKTFS